VAGDPKASDASDASLAFGQDVKRKRQPPEPEPEPPSEPEVVHYEPSEIWGVRYSTEQIGRFSAYKSSMHGGAGGYIYNAGYQSVYGHFLYITDRAGVTRQFQAVGSDSIGNAVFCCISGAFRDHYGSEERS
jgi:hypothetical protein